MVRNKFGIRLSDDYSMQADLHHVRTAVVVAEDEGAENMLSHLHEGLMARMRRDVFRCRRHPSFRPLGLGGNGSAERQEPSP